MILRTKTEAGFTIVETMIVLGISGLMFVLAISAMSGKQQQTEFQTGVDTLSSALNQQLNNVDDGNYATSDNINCQATSSGPNLMASSSDGSCDIIGEVIAFNGTSTTTNSYKVYPVYGDTYNSSGNQATDINDAMPAFSTATGVNTSYDLPFGLTLATFSHENAYSISPDKNGALALISFTSFAGTSAYDTSNNLNSGSSHVEIFDIPGSEYGNPSTVSVTGLTDTHCTTANTYVCFVTSETNQWPIDPSSGITFCVDSGTSENESALFTIGGPYNPNSATYKIYNGGNCY